MAKTKTAPTPGVTAKADRWRGFPIGRLGLGPKIEDALAAGDEAKNLPPIETLGDLADQVRGENPASKLVAYGGIGGTRADAILAKLRAIKEATEKIASGLGMGPEEREAVSGARQAAAKHGPKAADGLLRMEVKPNRVLCWPWSPFPARAYPGDIVLEDDPLVDPTPETIAALKEAGFTGAQVFDQRHKLWVAEEERQKEDPTPIKETMGARVMGALDYGRIDVAAASAPRASMRRGGDKPRDAAAAPTRRSPAPAPTAESETDLSIPPVDDFKDIDEALAEVEPPAPPAEKSE